MFSIFKKRKPTNLSEMQQEVDRVLGAGTVSSLTFSSERSGRTIDLVEGRGGWMPVFTDTRGGGEVGCSPLASDEPVDETEPSSKSIYTQWSEAAAQYEADDQRVKAATSQLQALRAALAEVQADHEAKGAEAEALQESLAEKQAHLEMTTEAMLGAEALRKALLTDPSAVLPEAIDVLLVLNPEVSPVSFRRSLYSDVDFEGECSKPFNRRHNIFPAGKEGWSTHNPGGWFAKKPLGKLALRERAPREFVTNHPSKTIEAMKEHFAGVLANLSKKMLEPSVPEVVFICIIGEKFLESFLDEAEKWGEIPSSKCFVLLIDQRLELEEYRDRYRSVKAKLPLCKELRAISNPVLGDFFDAFLNIYRESALEGASGMAEKQRQLAELQAEIATIEARRATLISEQEVLAGRLTDHEGLIATQADEVKRLEEVVSGQRPNMERLAREVLNDYREREPRVESSIQ